MLNRSNDRASRWRARLAILAAGYISATALTGLSIWLLPFSVPNQIAVLVHTAVGLLFLVPCLWYVVRHFLDYWAKPLSHLSVLGYLSAAALLGCLLSGLVLTWQAVFGTRIGYGWDIAHIVTTIAVLAFGGLHIALIVVRDRRSTPMPAGHYGVRVLGLTAAAVLLIGIVYVAHRPPMLDDRLPDDYSYLYGPVRPFAPSLARTPNNEALDPRWLSGSSSCGTAGCHEQIVKEWEPSAHRYAAMDTGFQKIQMNMATMNGPESTRYCGGCHDPISLFSGAKNLFTDTEKLTSLHGYREGVSCLACHAVRQVDVKGNANYVVTRPVRYMFELEYDETPKESFRFLRDFLIRAYPKQHVKDLSKRLFKTPEYCAACHKQFIDQEINNLGWVQLQNQYDNWRQSHWNRPGVPARTIECRECHMPLVDSTDPAAGDPADYNRSAKDRKHRSHRFLGANQMMPALLKLPGWEEHTLLTEKWLRGEHPVPEIAHKWRSGPAVTLAIEAPDKIPPGGKVDLRMVVSSNKVGHDFPTGPLDIIQAWLEVLVSDERGDIVFSRGTLDDKGFIEPGTFMFKAEPVDRFGNLIDRHNLWEMVGVRYRRSLFPGFADTAELSFDAPRKGGSELTVAARLCYRKIDQYLMNFMFGEQSGLTSPVTVMAQTMTKVAVEP
ncbi:MAG: hypothetical protein KIT09_00180 [Bryobacteraceae bacterium]|nr:hypothetical protein [Bryobacteraceae bacterium]